MGLLTDVLESNNKDFKEALRQNIKLPANQLLWVSYYGKLNDGKIKYFISSDKIRETYYLYEVVDDSGNIKIIKKYSNPSNFEKYIII